MLNRGILFQARETRLILLNLLAELLVEALTARSHDSVLTDHPSVESALELGAQGELAHGVGLFIGEDDALRGEGLVLHAIEASGDVADLGVGRIGRLDGGSERGSHAVGAEANRVAVLGRVSCWLILLLILLATAGLRVGVRRGPGKRFGHVERWVRVQVVLKCEEVEGLRQ